jgi:hypothetical protein
MNTAVRVLELEAQDSPNSFDIPHVTTARMWLLRLGYFKLHRPKERADDWIWIIDHINQLGTLRCLMMTGFRLSQWGGRPRPLTLEDLEPLAILPVTSSNQEVVYQQLREQVTELGIPRGILSDEGGDLVKGAERLCRDFPQIGLLSDIAHRAARSLKHRLEKDPRWSSFVQQATQTKFQVQQTELGCLTPPSLRSKARYMNVKPLTDWAEKHLMVVEERPAEVLKVIHAKRLEEKLGWLRDYRQEIQQWAEYQRVIDSTVHFVRHKGYFAGAAEQLRANLATVAVSQRGAELSVELVDFVKEQSQAVRPGEHLPGSSEIIESSFGKLKHLEGDQSRGGFTHLLLAFAAMLGPTTKDTVRQALIETPVKRVVNWCRRYLGSTLQAQRSKISHIFRRRRRAKQNPEEVPA